ncbi:MAG: ADP-forming succinate--CoA ligase subunit beta [Spirochaetes bacterium]|jgi:succinyl-CoA synthetase beta subunit|nr:ADP-forming succinate--CoA ligase subunit beta [Spirochaetota bacterium]
MKIHEYQAKELFAEFGIPVEPQEVVDNAADAKKAAEKIGETVVIKAQVLVGGRGKAGGVKLAKTPDEAEKAAADILKLTIKDIPVEKVMVTRAAKIEQEFYVGLTTDRAAKQLILMMSREGGVEIEELAVTNPEKIIRFHINPADGIDDAGLKKALQEVFEKPELVSQAEDAVRKMYTLYLEKDASLVEINPYARIDGNTLKALDAKMNFDDNAMFKHPDVEKMRNAEEYSQDEIDARQAGLSFVSMDGEIGCIVNGAGLAMATMDIIKLYGGTPANFLDVGGSSNPEKVVNALRIITRNPKVKAILINIFGGITRCDDIAKGILTAMEQIDLDLPMVIRLIGTNDEEGRAMLAEKDISAYQKLSDAVEQVVKSA